MLIDSLVGARYFLRGLGLLNKPGVRRFVIVPLLINVLLFTGLIWFAAAYFEALMDRFLPQLPDWLGWLSALLWVVFALAALLIIFFTFTLIANLLGAPFNAYLADAVERHLTGRKPVSRGKSVIVEVITAIAGELRKYAYFALWVLPLLVLFLIPVINVVAPALWLVFGAWMLTIEYVDYPMGNHGLAFPEQRRRLRTRRMLSLSFGGAVMLATMVPLLNLLVMPTAVAGATAMWVEEYLKREPKLPDTPQTAPPVR